jgi:hypothetical protein
MNAMPGEDDIAMLERLAREGCRAAEHGDLPALEEGLSRRRQILPRVEEMVANAGTRLASKELASRLERVLEIDREAERHLSRGRAELEAQVASMERGDRGLRGYSAGGPARGKRVDERR